MQAFMIDGHAIYSAFSMNSFVVLNNHIIVLVCSSHFGINFQSMIQWVFLCFSTLQAAAFH